MRLTSDEARGLNLCLMALKRQRQALSMRIDEVKNVLDALEAADETAAFGLRSEPLRAFKPDQQQSASA